MRGGSLPSYCALENVDARPRAAPATAPRNHCCADVCWLYSLLLWNYWRAQQQVRHGCPLVNICFVTCSQLDDGFITSPHQVLIPVCRPPPVLQSRRCTMGCGSSVEAAPQDSRTEALRRQKQQRWLGSMSPPRVRPKEKPGRRKPWEKGEMEEERPLQSARLFAKADTSPASFETSIDWRAAARGRSPSPIGRRICRAAASTSARL